jgi:hypothetical protein
MFMVFIYIYYPFPMINGKNKKKLEAILYFFIFCQLQNA